MNPDHISTFPVLDNLVRESLIDLDIIDPRVILVRLALRVIGNLVMEDRPQNLLAIVGVVSIKIAILAEDRQRIILGSQSILNILFLLCIFESVRRHAQCSDPGLIMKLSGSNSCIDSISKTTISLIGRYNCPICMCEDSVMAVASSSQLRLPNASSTKRCCLLCHLIMLEYVCRGWRASSRSRLIEQTSRTPGWRVWVTWGDYRMWVLLILLRKVGSALKLLILVLCKEILMVYIRYWCLRRCDFSLLGE